MIRLAPIDFQTACSMVSAWHRHHRPPVGHKFSIGLASTDYDAEDGAPVLVGAIIVGRPVARHLDDGKTVEVTRVVTYGTRNACSMLYGAACREARRRGYERVITYTRADETGASVKAANFVAVATTKGRQWDTPSRPRAARPTADRIRWERRLTTEAPA